MLCRFRCYADVDFSPMPVYAIVYDADYGAGCRHTLRLLYVCCHAFDI